jgi:hypothetical protein
VIYGDIMNRLYRFILLSSSVLFLLISYSLSTLDQAKGYEISIYSEAPLIFLIIIAGVVDGIFVIVLGYYNKIGKIWLLGVFQIILFNFIAISLYALRGYVLYLVRGDTAGYVGMAKDISDYGHILDYNFYPIVSLFISQTSQIANVPIIIISEYLSSLFFGIYVISIYCWSKSISEDKKFITACMIASAPVLFPWFSTSIYHMLLSVLMIPFLFYCIQRSSDNRFKFLSIVMVLIYPLFHPITAVMVFIYICVIYLYQTFIEHRSKTISVFLILIAFASLAKWFVSQYDMLHDVKLIIMQISGMLGTPSTAVSAKYYIQKLGLIKILRSLVLVNANQIIFYVLSTISIFYIVRNRRFAKKNIVAIGTIGAIGASFLIGSIFIVIIFFTSNSHNPDRLINLNTNMILTSPLVGSLIYRSSYKKQVLIIGLIALSSITAILSIYQSPIIMYPNDQMTNNEIKSMDWFLYNKEPNVKTVDVLTPIVRYGEIISGYNSSSRRDDLYEDIPSLPDHFNLSDNKMFFIDRDRYLVITKFDIVAYTEIWKDIHRFEKQDFINMERLENVDKIYDSGEVLFYLIRKY